MAADLGDAIGREPVKRFNLRVTPAIQSGLDV
jgi:hypothetical protein